MRQDLTSTLKAAFADPLGFVGRPKLTIYLASGATSWAWDDADTPMWFDVQQMYAGTGTDPATCEVRLYSDSLCIDGSTPQQAAVSSARALHGLRLVLSLAVRTSAGTEDASLFDGVITQEKANTIGTTLVATAISSRTAQRQGSMPVELLCPWVLYSADCGATRQSMTLTTASGSTSTSIKVAGSTGPGTADQVVMPNGQQALVRSAGPGVINLDRPVTPPASGLLITVTRGCGKRIADCTQRHNNTARYGGCPLRPVRSLTGV